MLVPYDAVERELDRRVARREWLRTHPFLRYLFFELCDACNLSCLHCGSSCGEGRGTFIDPASVEKVLREVASAYDPSRILVCITGGEPMLHPRFFDIVTCARDLGFHWGMTTNATLIDEAVAERLVQAGMRTVSVSVDGTREVHDAFRRVTGAHDRALEGIRAMNELLPVEVITVVHKACYPYLEDIYIELLEERVAAWRVVNIEPIGRALENPSIMLSDEELVGVLDFIAKKRADPSVDMIVSYGCSHYVGPAHELEVRDHCFLCGAGLWVASVTCEGDIYSCLDIERRPELVQGNVARDSFVDAWEHGFARFRTSRVPTSPECSACPHARWCDADSTHTWDYDAGAPRLCMVKVFERLGLDI